MISPKIVKLSVTILVLASIIGCKKSNNQGNYPSVENRFWSAERTMKIRGTDTISNAQLFDHFLIDNGKVHFYRYPYSKRESNHYSVEGDSITVFNEDTITCQFEIKEKQVFLKYRTKEQELNKTYTFENYHFVHYNPEITNELDKYGVHRDSLFSKKRYFHYPAVAQQIDESFDTSSMNIKYSLEFRESIDCKLTDVNELKIENDTFEIVTFLGFVLVLKNKAIDSLPSFVYVDEKTNKMYGNHIPSDTLDSSDGINTK